jgi:hypothetical protein
MDVPIGNTTLHLTQKRALLLLLAFGLLGVGGYEYVQQSQAIDDAVAVEATVTDATIDRIESGRGATEYEPGISYTYRSEGRTYTNDDVFPGPSIRTYTDRTDAQAIVEQHEPGTTVRAYVLPSDPTTAFLIRARSPWPLQAIVAGSALLVVGVLAALGSQQPGRQKLKPPAARDHSAPDWLARYGDTVERWSKRLIAASFVGFWLSLVVLVLSLASTTGGLDGAPQDVHATLFGPIGVSVLAVVSCYLGLILSLCLYGSWSFMRYRRLRTRLREPVPPSPFRHPTRLVTIIGTDGEALSTYGRRVRVTGWALLFASILSGVFTTWL